MKEILVFLLLQIIGVASGFSENPRWGVNGIPVPASTNLDVRWDSLGKRLPARVWIYQLLPNRFSPEVISNVTRLCSFTERDKTVQNQDGMTFQSADGFRKLTISFPSGSIHYQIPEPTFGPANLAVGVPPMSQLPELATNVLRKLHINFSDVTGYFGSRKFELDETGMMYFLDHSAITNIAHRTVYFRRSVDGLPVFGDRCSFDFGEHGRLAGLSIAWPNLKRSKSFPTVSRTTVLELVRQGRAIHGPVPSNVSDIDWPNVKSILIKNATPCYSRRNSDRLFPFLKFDGSVDTGHGIVVLGMACSIIDETKLPKEAP
jgi:hypothetical protein